MSKKLVVIESPFAGDVEENLKYLKEVMRKECLEGNAPIASHLLYTQFLHDEISEERKIGMECGFAWNEKADVVHVYIDRGISKGMLLGVMSAVKQGKQIILKSLKGDVK